MGLTIWIVCGLVAGIFALAYLEEEFPGPEIKRKEHIVISCIVGMCGPIGLAVILIVMAFSGNGILFK